ncbi:cytoplasmic protein [Escherichia fergusonii]|nr:cytoplasmic protein [Escherichia fergusonii]
MSEDYVIEWDKDFADDLNVVASVFLQHTPTLWLTIFSQLSTQPETFEDEDEDEYGLQDVLDCSGGDLGNHDLAQAFLQVLRGEGLIQLVDWKGEDEEGELANFAADRFYELTKNLTASEELRNLLVEITQEDEISDVCEAGDRYLDEIFERIQTELNKRGFQIFDLNEGSDTYNVVVLPMNDYKKIDDFNTPWLEVQDFLS